MKQFLTILGYLASLFLVATLAFRINHYPGHEIIMTIAGVLLSLYFPVHILEMGREINNGKIHAVNYALAATVFFVTLGITLKLSHLNFGSLALLIGIGSFCLIYCPLLFIKKSKEPGSNNLAVATGILGMMMFPLGILFMVYLHLPFAPQMFTVGLLLVFLIFLPLFLFDKSLAKEVRQKQAQTMLFRLVIAALLFICLFRAVYPGRSEQQDLAGVQQSADISRK